jgi:GT2 family glycosyltransferase
MTDVNMTIVDKPYYELVFVVLVYRNIDVLRQFFSTLTLSCGYRVIVVNSFFNQETEDACRALSDEYDADFISVPNKGFGAGNNRGCSYVMDHYRYRFLILSNSDVIIRDISCLMQMEEQMAVYAADIRMENGHRQNPHLPFKVGLYLKLLDLSYKWKSNVLMNVAFAFNRVLRELVLAWTKMNGGRIIRIFSAHGSFIVMTYQASQVLNPIFHEGMFLYNEELYLAHRCRMLRIPVYYVPRLKIIHMEGASSTKQSNAWKNHEESYRVLSLWIREQNAK